MTDKEKQEHEAILLEIQSRKEVLKKIENAYKRLKKQAKEARSYDELLKKEIDED